MQIFAVKRKKKCLLSSYKVENPVKLDLREILCEDAGYFELHCCPIVDLRDKGNEYSNSRKGKKF
jgi:hypothetical protein